MTKVKIMENKPEESKSAGGVVVNAKGEILVVSQKGNSWSLPKGIIEDDEDAFSAAKREIYEESGINELEFVRELGSYERFRISADGKGEDISVLKTITLYLFRTIQVDLKPIDKDNPEARWIHKNEVANLLTHPKDKEFFLSIKDEI